MKSPLFNIFQISGVNKKICEKKFCRCDVEAANCFKKYADDYNPAMRRVSKAQKTMESFLGWLIFGSGK